ncbi:MAG: glycoside hydrolase [Ruminococcus sp.]|nr:glycoside hydrolase [Ruminococcus sp.]
MDLRKIISLALAMTVPVAGISGCAKKKSKADDDVSIVEVEPTTAETTEPVTTSPAENYPDYPISYPTIEKKDTGDLYEAEDAKLSEGLAVEPPQPAEGEEPEDDTEEKQEEEEPKEYSGKGYVTGFKPDGSTSVVFKVNAPTIQHYDLSFCIASDKEVECQVSLNGSEISRFKTKRDGDFTLITLYGVFLTNGGSEIEIRPENGNVKLDYLKLSNNTTLSQLSYDAKDQLVNANAAENTKKLMTFLTENYGETVITGQYASSEENKELDLIYQTTGKYPVIRFSAIHNSGSSFDDAYKDIDACADWYRKGGIVGLMWYWEAPDKKKPSVYAKETDFSLSDAMTDIDIAKKSQEEIRGLFSEGKISEQCYGLILDIDNMAGHLTSLRNKGIPVLWRPLHEGSGDWFWWGADGTDAYKWLWKLVYTRMTEYFELDNLIWIWNGQSADSMVDAKTFDIASLDIYLSPEKYFGSRYEQFAAMQKIVGKDKLIALSECSSVPDIDITFRDNAVWSFFGTWYGKYLTDEKGEYSEKYCPKETLIRTYNSDGALTLDEYRVLTGWVEPEAPADHSTQAPTETEPAGTETTKAEPTEAATEKPTETTSEAAAEAEPTKAAQE